MLSAADYPLITLTTDFGVRDPYAAAMKGVIHRLCPKARIEDLTHAIAPRDVWEAAYFLAGAAPWFPRDTIHVAVVDPGVGTERRPLLVHAGGQYFIGPDNGIFSVALREFPLESAHVIENPAFMLHNVSPTFHGRDIFAPAAARLANGADAHDAGPVAKQLIALDIPEPSVRSGGVIEGEIVRVDRFGNAVTNIHRRLCAADSIYTVRAGGAAIPEISRTYGDRRAGELLALFGSSGYLEIAVNQGSATDAFTFHRGTPVHLAPVVH